MGMRARNELNEILYRKKMEERKIPDYPVRNAMCTAIACGDMKFLNTELESGVCPFFSSERVLSKDGLRNTVLQFALAASEISHACINAGLGLTEAYTLSELYILKADECSVVEDVCRLYVDLCSDFAERMQEIRKEAVISLHVRKCIDYIYENLGADLSVKALSKIVGLNCTYFSKLFCQEVGVPIKQFVKEARVDTAKNLLSCSDLPCSEMAASLGFSTQSVFIAVFKEIVGVTPKIYREKYYMKKK